VLRLLGGSLVKVFTYGDCCDRIARIPGKMNKREWLSFGDLVLIKKRAYQDNKCEITLKYTTKEAQELLTEGEYVTLDCIALLSSELLAQILGILPPKDLQQSSWVSKSWRKACLLSHNSKMYTVPNCNKEYS